MYRRLAVLLVAALALGVTATAGADTATPLSPDDAGSLVAGAAASGSSATTEVDPTTVLAAASSPDAVTSYESDMTLDAAVGLDTGPSSLAARAGTASLGPVAQPKVVCWTEASWGHWGTWPYDQKITDTTYWCAKYGVKVTFRSTSVTAGGTLCGVSWRAGQLIAGGTGFPSFTMRSSVGFACPTDIPWIVLHPSHHIDVSRDDRGGASIVGMG